MPGIHLPEVIFLLLTVFWLWALIDCMLNKSLKGTQKVLWFLLILFTHILGTIIYFGANLYSTFTRSISRTP